MRPILRLIVCLIAIAAAEAVPAQVDPLDACIQRLRRAATVQRDGQHSHLLRSLRSLGDPTLAPFFARLVEQDDLIIRINGMLGLGEVGDSESIDPWQVHQLSSEVERLQAIEQALLFDLLDEAGIRAMLAWDDLEDAPRIVLLGDLVRRRANVDAAVLEALAAHEKETIRALASMLLVQITESRDHFDAMRSHIAAMEPAARRQAYMWLLNDIGRYQLDQMVWWIAELLAEPEVDSRVALAAVAAAIHADLEQGLPLWKDRARADTSHANLVRLGLVLMAMISEHDVPADAFALLRNGEVLTEAMADVGIAVATGDGQVDALTAMIDLDHWQSSNHALFIARKLESADQVAVYRHIVERVEKSEVRPDERITLAIRAIPPMVEQDVDAAGALLASAKDDSRLQEAILMGLLACDEPAVGALGRDVPRIGAGRADSLAMLLMARHAEPGTLDETHMRELGSIASGGGQVSPSYEVQAAWLYIKHAGRIEFAINRLFGGE